jgi:hypothetical protein
MSAQDFNHQSVTKDSEHGTEAGWDEEEWDREHWDRWMDTVRSNQRDPQSFGSLGGTPYQGGVYTSATYGSGAEYYSITGMYENPLLERPHRPHRGRTSK